MNDTSKAGLSVRRRRRQYGGAQLERLGNILQVALKRRNVSLNVKDDRLWGAWKKAVGPLIDAQTAVDRFERQTLFVKVSGPAWMQQLQFMKPEVKARVNEILGQDLVKDIYFSVGYIAGTGTAAKETYTPPTNLSLSEREKRQIDKCLSVVSDGELGEILRRAMTRNFIRRKMDERKKAR
ncbi:MAG: DUF721 domain-containing protein [Syntrophobacterales bacterium]|nr:DUF721 domain-containing protein [Syntrophobacterales bacterium]